DLIHIEHFIRFGFPTRPTIRLKHLDQALYPVAFRLSLHLERDRLSLERAADKASLVKRTLDRVVHHVMRDDALLRTLNGPGHNTIPDHLHAVVLSGTLGEDELHGSLYYLAF